MKKKGLAMMIGLFAALIWAAVALMGAIGARSREAEKAQVLSSVRAAALTCYAVEGAFPASLDYLKTYYGLVYDESAFLVSYDAFASNIIPDIYVVEGGGRR